jgi:hypothetical protein
MFWFPNYNIDFLQPLRLVDLLRLSKLLFAQPNKHRRIAGHSQLVLLASYTGLALTAPFVQLCLKSRRQRIVRAFDYIGYLKISTANRCQLAYLLGVNF